MSDPLGRNITTCARAWPQTPSLAISGDLIAGNLWAELTKKNLNKENLYLYFFLV